MAKTALNNQGSSPCHLRSPWRLPKMRASPWSLPRLSAPQSPSSTSDFQGPHSQEPSGRQQHQTLKAHLRKPGSNWANEPIIGWSWMKRTKKTCPIWVLWSVAKPWTTKCKLMHGPRVNVRPGSLSPSVLLRNPSMAAAMVRKLFSRVVVAEQMNGGQSFIMLGTPKNIQYTTFLPCTWCHKWSLLRSFQVRKCSINLLWRCCNQNDQLQVKWWVGDAALWTPWIILDWDGCWIPSPNEKYWVSRSTHNIPWFSSSSGSGIWRAVIFYT